MMRTAPTIDLTVTGMHASPDGCGRSAAPGRGLQGGLLLRQRDMPPGNGAQGVFIEEVRYLAGGQCPAGGKPSGHRGVLRASGGVLCKR